LRPGLGAFRETLRHDVPRAGQGFLDRGRPSLLVDESQRLDQGIAGALLLALEEERRQRLQALLAGDGGPGAALGAVGQVDVLEFGQSRRCQDRAAQLVGEKAALLERLQDRLTALVQLCQLGQTVTDRGDRHLIQRAGRLLPIAGNERDGAPFFQQGGGRGHLPGGQGQLARDPIDVVVLHRVVLVGLDHLAFSGSMSRGRPGLVHRGLTGKPF